jgi:excinuclease ABC subunit C
LTPSYGRPRVRIVLVHTRRKSDRIRVPQRRYNLPVLQNILEFSPERDREIFTAVPPVPAIFLVRGESGEPYASKTANLRRRLMRLLAPPELATRRLNLRDRVKTIEFTPTASDFESGLLLYRVLRAEFPQTYADRLRLRPAPLIRLILENPFPRVSVTTRISTLRGRSLYYGPFPTRAAAEKFANDSLDFFKLRRCVDDLHPDPAFPGCIYSEMKMCLAPCFQGCTEDDYRAETSRVQAFFDSGGQSLRNDLTRQRDQASASLEFEAAAALHSRLEKLTCLIPQLPEIVHRLDRLNGLIVQPSAERDCVALFRIEAGRLNGPLQFPLQLRPSATNEASTEKRSPSEGVIAFAAAKRPASMESRLKAVLAAMPLLPPGSARETMEQLAYLKRWWYRNSKIGESFFAEADGELPMRRVIRGISRVFRGEKATAELSDTARDYWINRGKASKLNPDNYNV